MLPTFYIFSLSISGKVWVPGGVEVRYSPFRPHWTQLWHLEGWTSQLSENRGRPAPGSWARNTRTLSATRGKSTILLFLWCLPAWTQHSAEVSSAVLRSWGSGSCPPSSCWCCSPQGAVVAHGSLRAWVWGGELHQEGEARSLSFSPKDMARLLKCMLSGWRTKTVSRDPASTGERAQDSTDIISIPHVNWQAVHRRWTRGQIQRAPPRLWRLSWH